MLDVTSSHAQASHGEPSHARKDTYGPVKTSLRLLGVDERLRPHLPTASHQTAERGAMAGHPIALGGRLFVGGRALVKAGRRPPPSGGFGLDMGPTTDSARRQAVNRQERADSQPPAAREKPLDRHPCHMRENTGTRWWRLCRALSHGASSDGGECDIGGRSAASMCPSQWSNMDHINSV